MSGIISFYHCVIALIMYSSDLLTQVITFKHKLAKLLEYRFTLKESMNFNIQFYIISLEKFYCGWRFILEEHGRIFFPFVFYMTKPTGLLLIPN